MNPLNPSVSSPQNLARRHWLRRLYTGAGLGLALGLGGCGFALRQAPTLAFDSVRVQGGNASGVAGALGRALEGMGVRVEGAGGPAQTVLNVQVDQRERAVVGQTATGQVRELQLRTRFQFQLSTLAGKELLPATELLLERDISFTETAVLAKEAEENLLYRDMQTDIVQQVLRRLAAVPSL